ncbi:unnamed protein product, partial [Sphagnum troendelagicum]
MMKLVAKRVSPGFSRSSANFPSSNWCVTTEGTLSQARTPDPVHPRRCARILVAVAVKTSSQYLHLTLSNAALFMKKLLASETGL